MVKERRMMMEMGINLQQTLLRRQKTQRKVMIFENIHGTCVVSLLNKSTFVLSKTLGVRALGVFLCYTFNFSN